MVFNPFDKSINELNQLEPAQGRVLIAEPFMEDPYFKRSVVLLAEHNDKGTIGFITNHLLEITIEDILPELKGIEAKVYMGGPVEAQHLFYIHRLGDLLPGSKHIVGDLFWDGDFEVLISLLLSGEINSSDIQFLLGYSGWGVEQMKNELKQNSWFVQNLKGNGILNNNGLEFWKETIRSSRSEIAMMANFPEDPSLN